MPALLTRKDDLDLLVKHLLHQLELKHGFDNIVISADVMKRFEAHDWPGNVRELQNVLESSLIAADQGMITLECLPDYLQQNARPSDLLYRAICGRLKNNDHGNAATERP
jgi:two-component system NtrC family response regulator